MTSGPDDTCYKLVMSLFISPQTEFKRVDKSNRKDRNWNKNTGVPPFIVIGDCYSIQDDELPRSSAGCSAERVAYL